MPQSPADDLMGDASQPLLDSVSVDSNLSEDATEKSHVCCMVGNNNTSNFIIPINVPVPEIPVAQNINLNINLKLEVVPDNCKEIRRDGIYFKMYCGGQQLVEREFGNEMTNTSCFTMLANYFHKRYLRLRGVRRGCIILDLCPESPEALKLLIDDVRSGEFSNLLSGVLQKRKIFDRITKPELNVQIEVVVAESLFMESGLSRADLEPITMSCKINREHTEYEGCTGAEAIDTSQYTDSPTQTEQSAIDGMIHLITVGRTRVGKSSLDNIITQSNSFPSTFSAFPVTLDCQTDRFIRDRVLYSISDTPGVDSHQDQTSNLSAATKIAALVKSQLGRTYFLLTFRLGEKKEDVLALKYFKTLLGPQFTQSCIVVFTGKESLDYEGLTLEDYIQTDPSLIQLKEEVDNRMVTVSKGGSPGDHEEFIDQLLAHVGSLQQRDVCYTWSMLEQALLAEDERQRQILQEKATQEMKEREAIEDIVMQNLRVDMRRQLDLQDLQNRRLDDLQPGLRRPVESDITDEDMVSSQKKPRTEITP